MKMFLCFHVILNMKTQNMHVFMHVSPFSGFILDHKGSLSCPHVYLYHFLYGCTCGEATRCHPYHVEQCSAATKQQLQQSVEEGESQGHVL